MHIIVICEGETEQEFCQKTLSRHLAPYNITIGSPIIGKSRGGIVKWPSLKNQITAHLRQATRSYVTTLIDYYGIETKHEFPEWEESKSIVNKEERMDFLEGRMKADINNDIQHRFIPYIQLHEFEGLLFNRIDLFDEVFEEDEIKGKDELERVFHEFDNPEMINNGKETSPSHRLERIIEGYDKVVYGNILAEKIGIEHIRNKSPRFNHWIETLIALGTR